MLNRYLDWRIVVTLAAGLDAGSSCAILGRLRTSVFHHVIRRETSPLS